VKHDNLCFKCFARNKVTQYTSKFSCRECKKQHHTSLLSLLPHRNHTTSSSCNATWTDFSNTWYTSSYNRHCFINYYWSFTQLLPLQKVTFYSKREHSTPSLADKLNLHPTNWTISVSSFRTQVSSSRSLEVATLLIHMLNSTLIPISVLNVEQLATSICNSVHTQLNKVPYLKGVVLSHPIAGDENFEISLLFGAGYYWHFVQDEIQYHPTATSHSHARVDLLVTE